MGPRLTATGEQARVSPRPLRALLAAAPVSAALWWCAWVAWPLLPPSWIAALATWVPGMPEWPLAVVLALPALILAQAGHRLRLAARAVRAERPWLARPLARAGTLAWTWLLAWGLLGVAAAWPDAVAATTRLPVALGLPAALVAGGVRLPVTPALVAGVMVVLWAWLAAACARARHALRRAADDGADATPAPPAEAVSADGGTAAPARPHGRPKREVPSAPAASPEPEAPRPAASTPGTVAVGEPQAAAPAPTAEPAAVAAPPSRAPSRLGWLGQRRAVVALDLGHGTLKLLQAVRVGDGLAVSAAARTVLPPRAYRRGQVIDPAALAGALRQLCHELRVRSRRAAAAVAGEATFLRTVPFPRMTEDELRAAMRWEADKYLPLRYEDAMVDFRILDLSVRQLWPPGRVPDGQIPVLLGACPRALALALVDVVDGAGLELVELEPQPLAAFRALTFACGPERAAGVVALVELGFDGGYVTVFKHGTPLLHRSLARSVFGPEALTADADPAALEPEPVRVEQVLAEVRRSLEAAVTQLRVPRLRVVLTGDGAAHPATASRFREILEDAMAAPADGAGGVVAFGPGDGGRWPRAVPEPVAAAPAAWAAALGLALRGLGVPVARPPVVDEAAVAEEPAEVAAGREGDGAA